MSKKNTQYKIKDKKCNVYRDVPLSCPLFIPCAFLSHYFVFLLKCVCSIIKKKKEKERKKEKKGGRERLYQFVILNEGSESQGRNKRD